MVGNLDKVIKKSFFFIGIFSTLGAFMINIGGFETAITNVFIIIVLGLQLLKRRINIKNYKIPLIILFFTMIISSISSMYNLESVWVSESINSTLKVIMFLMPFTILFMDKELLFYRKEFFRGLLASCYIQVIWEILQVVLWNLKTISLNEIVFGKILKQEISHTWTFISDGRFRPSGVSWEPANLGLSLVIGYVLCNSKYSKILFSIGIFLSTSRTAIIVWVLVNCIYILKYRPISFNRKKIRMKYLDLFIILGGMILGLIFLLYFSENIINIIQPIIHGISTTFEKLDLSGMKSDASANMHGLYYLKYIDIIKNTSLFQLIFGYGTATAGFPYSEYLNIYTYLPYWNPESDFITILIGNGMLGAVTYYWFMIKNLKYNENDSKAFLSIVTILIAGLFYLYFRSSWPFLIAIMLFVKGEGDGGNNII